MGGCLSGGGKKHEVRELPGATPYFTPGISTEHQNKKENMKLLIEQTQ
jgi:hypothetical protein